MNDTPVSKRSQMRLAPGATATVTVTVNPGPVTVDQGTYIAPDSLAKASDGLSIYWIQGGVAKNAPLQ